MSTDRNRTPEEFVRYLINSQPSPVSLGNC